MTRPPFASYSINAIPRAPETGDGGGDAAAAAAAAAATAAAAGAGGGGDKGAGGGGADKPWYEAADYGFDGDTQKFFQAKNYPDIKTALNSLPQFERIARDRNVISKPNPEKLAEWEGWETLGWKKDIKDYAVKKPALKDGQVLDEAMFSTFVQDAHELRIPLAAAQALFEKQFGKAYERIAAMDAAGAGNKAKLETDLKAEWGDNYDANMERAKKAMKATGLGMDGSAKLEKLIGSPRLAKYFSGLGEKLGEDKLVSGTGGGPQTPAAARAQRMALEGDPEWVKVFNNPRDPRNKDYVAQRQALIELEARK
jgi:hypothetical protein